jgi:O-antigen/teichoic acid export membrane protein
MLKKAAPLGITAVLVAIYYKAGFVLLSYFRGDTEVGYYNSAYTVVNTLLLFAATLSGTLLPRLSSLFIVDFAVLGNLYRTAFKYLLFIGLGFAFGATFLAKPVFMLVYGPAYLPGAAALAILIWASALMFVNSLQGTLLIASNMKRQLVYLTGTAAIANIILNVILIPKFGFRGAAVTAVVSEAIAGTWAFVLLREHIPFKYLLSLLLKAILASIVMILLIEALSSMNVIWRVAIGIAVYGICLLVFRGIDSADLRIVKKLLKAETSS